MDIINKKYLTLWDSLQILRQKEEREFGLQDIEQFWMEGQFDIWAVLRVGACQIYDLTSDPITVTTPGWLHIKVRPGLDLNDCHTKSLSGTKHIEVSGGQLHPESIESINFMGGKDYLERSENWYLYATSLFNLDDLRIEAQKLLQFSKLFKVNPEQEISTQGKNALLKTIQKLSEALIDGLTDHHTNDAKAVLMALSEKGIEAPVGDKALGNYLKKAKEL